jgi:hypothetical protein
MTVGNGASRINKSSEMVSGENIPDLTSAGDAVREIKNADGDMEDQDAGTLVSRLSEAPRREIEDLVGKLMTLHKQLQTDGDRIQLDIMEYTDLNQRVRQLTTIIADSVGGLSDPRRG